LKWVDGTESPPPPKIDIELSASKTLVTNLMFYLIAKMVLFLISETQLLL